MCQEGEQTAAGCVTPAPFCAPSVGECGDLLGLVGLGYVKGRAVVFSPGTVTPAENLHRQACPLDCLFIYVVAFLCQIVAL